MFLVDGFKEVCSEKCSSSLIIDTGNIRETVVSEIFERINSIVTSEIRSRGKYRFTITGFSLGCMIAGLVAGKFDSDVSYNDAFERVVLFNPFLAKPEQIPGRVPVTIAKAKSDFAGLANSNICQILGENVKVFEVKPAYSKVIFFKNHIHLASALAMHYNNQNREQRGGTPDENRAKICFFY